ncbi:MAG: helix-turn-helix transcriptional regulator [Stackebrandtia sp.]
MTKRRPGLTYREIADTYGRSVKTIYERWTKNPLWPEPIGKRGRFLEFDADAVAAVAEVETPQPQQMDGDPDDLLTVREIAEISDPPVTEATLRSYISKGLWPDPDKVLDGVKLWHRSTAVARLSQRVRKPRAR